MALETPSRPPPPFMAKTILNFHFGYLNPRRRRFMFGPVYSIFKEDYAGLDANKISLLKHFRFRGFKLGVRCKDKQTLQNRE